MNRSSTVTAELGPVSPVNTRFSWLMPVTTITVVLGIGLLMVLHPQALQFTDPDALSGVLIQLGLWGPAIYIALIILSVVISQIPGAPLAIAAGAIWDPLVAGLYTVIGGFGGALIAYGLGKSMGQSILKAITGKTLSFSTEHGEGYLGWLIFATRLLPVFSFDLVSYGAGITGLSFPVYASATFFGMLPSTLLLTYVGDSVHLGAGAIATLTTVFVVLFVAIPALLHRYNWLNMRSLVRWE